MDEKLLELLKAASNGKEIVKYLDDNYCHLNDGCGCCGQEYLGDILPKLEDL